MNKNKLYIILFFHIIAFSIISCSNESKVKYLQQEKVIENFSYNGKRFKIHSIDDIVAYRDIGYFLLSISDSLVIMLDNRFNVKKYWKIYYTADGDSYYLLGNLTLFDNHLTCMINRKIIWDLDIEKNIIKKIHTTPYKIIGGRKYSRPEMRIERAIRKDSVYYGYFYINKNDGITVPILYKYDKNGNYSSNFSLNIRKIDFENRSVDFPHVLLYKNVFYINFVFSPNIIKISETTGEILGETEASKLDFFEPYKVTEKKTKAYIYSKKPLMLINNGHALVNLRQKYSDKQYLEIFDMELKLINTLSFPPEPKQTSFDFCINPKNQIIAWKVGKNSRDKIEPKIYIFNKMRE
jgi:hypothetical protein